MFRFKFADRKFNALFESFLAQKAHEYYGKVFCIYSTRF